jgi:arylsulfatase A-like enzyme
VFYYYRADELQAVRSGKWKLVLPHKDPLDKVDIPLSLYNLDADIGETTDVIDKYPSIVARLQRHADRAREDLGDKITGAVGKGRRPCGQVAPQKK